MYLIRNINSCALKLIRTIIYVNLAIILLGFPAMGSTRPDPNFQNMGSTQPEKTRNSKIWAQPDPTRISKIWAQPNPKKPEFPSYGLNPTRLDPNFQDMGSTRPEKTRNSGQNGRVDPIFGSELSTLMSTSFLPCISMIFE